MIKIENVSVAFDHFYTLKGINVTLHEKRIGIIGSNGSGKSTFNGVNLRN